MAMKIFFQRGCEHIELLVGCQFFCFVDSDHDKPDLALVNIVPDGAMPTNETFCAVFGEQWCCKMYVCLCSFKGF